jgi:hypothetical protein
MEFLKRISVLEPARVRAIWAALVALLFSFGLVVSSDIDNSMSALIVAVFTILPVIQGESTRSKVSPVATLDQDVEEPDVMPDA